MSLRGSIFEPMFGEQSPVDEIIDAYDELYAEAKEDEIDSGDPYAIGNSNAAAYAKSMIDERLHEKARRAEKFKEVVQTLAEIMSDPRGTIIRYGMHSFHRFKQEGNARLDASLIDFEDATIRLAAKFTIALRDQEEIAAERLLQRMGKKDQFDEKLAGTRLKVRSLFERLRKTFRVERA